MSPELNVLFTIVEGWTQEIGPFTLRANGEPVDLTGMTVELLLRSSGSSEFFSTSGDVRLHPDQSGAGKGQVYFKPDAEDFVARVSPFFMRWKVTDTAGDVAFFPNKTANTVEVVEP